MAMLTMGEAVGEVQYFLSIGINHKNCDHVAAIVEHWGTQSHKCFATAADKITEIRNAATSVAGDAASAVS